MNGAMEQVMEQAVLQVVKQMEDDLDQQIHNLDNLGDSDLERVRQARMNVRTCEWVYYRYNLQHCKLHGLRIWNTFTFNKCNEVTLCNADVTMSCILSR